jgi:ubiquinone/menaquinone biosynthesis C-methylase UbiE
MKERQRIIDLGCGTGNLALKLLRSNKRVTAIDIDGTALKILRQKTKQFSKRLKVINASALHLPSLRKFDGICSMIVLPFVTSPQKYLENCFSLLKNNGVLSISSWLPSVSWKKLVEPEIKELKREGVIQTHFKEFQAIQSFLQKAPGIIRKRSLSKRELANSLKKIGFRKIHFCGTTHGGLCILINACK